MSDFEPIDSAPIAPGVAIGAVNAGPFLGIPAGRLRVDRRPRKCRIETRDGERRFVKEWVFRYTPG